MFTGPIEDRLKIRERFDSYSDAVSRIALDDYLRCWTDDPIRFGTGGQFHGVDQLRAHWDGIWRAVETMAFVTQIGAIEISGQDAYARSYCQETLRFRNGQTQQLVGAYTDELQCVDGDWLFSKRTYRIHIAAP
jgi:ketosteroid isomerase-like protein